MIPRPIDRQPPPPAPVYEPPAFDEIDATVIECHFPNDTVTFTLFAGDTHTYAGGFVNITYQDNPRIGRFREEFIINLGQVCYVAERRTKLQIRREPLTPAELTQGSQADILDKSGSID